MKRKALQFDPSPIRGPKADDRVLIIGRTGSGKSQFGFYTLSTRDFDKRPWVVMDYKGEDLWLDILADNKGKIKTISPDQNPPDKPGLYYMPLTPHVDDEAVEAWLFKVHAQAKKYTIKGSELNGCGLLVDEGYQLPQKAGFDLILTQGRSLGIPCIYLFQRPAWMSRFAVAQASFIAVFDQNDDRDCYTVSQYIRPVVLQDGREITVYDNLPAYSCLWYDVGKARTSILSPAPSAREIRQAFKVRLGTRTKEREIMHYA